MRDDKSSAGDNGSRVGDDGSRVDDNESWAGDDGSRAGNDGSQAGTYICARTHLYASRVYKGKEVSLRHMALFLLFLLPNMSSRVTTSMLNIRESH